MPKVMFERLMSRLVMLKERMLAMVQAFLLLVVQLVKLWERLIAMARAFVPVSSRWESLEERELVRV